MNEDEEEQGVDDVEIGEFAYDFVEHLREVKSNPQEHESYSMHSIEHLTRPPGARSDKDVSIYTREISRPSSAHIGY